MEKSKNLKLVTAIVQPHQLQEIEDSLFKAGITGMTVSNVLGCGQQQGYTASYRGRVHEVNLLKKIRIEIAVAENDLKTIVEAIIMGARTGNIGDGKIFITPLSDVIRIRTGECGKAAIGIPGPDALRTA